MREWTAENGSVGLGSTKIQIYIEVLLPVSLHCAGMHATLHVLHAEGESLI